MYHIKDLRGKRFGRLIVCQRSNKKTRSHATYWICKCDCGRGTVARSADLCNGVTRSCGCLRSEASKIRMLAFIRSKGRIING